MEKFGTLGLFVLIMFVSIFWRKPEHYTVGRIAEWHSSAQAKTGICKLIGDISMADVSTYADQYRSQDAYSIQSTFYSGKIINYA